MNKKLIALAVGAALATPLAASAGGPTVYGHLQAEISSEGVDVTGGPTAADGHVLQGGGGRFQEDIGVEDNKRGRLGVKGDYDLGDGLTAIYKFEFQVETTQADVDDGDRNAFVGLKGSFGTIKIGSLKTPYKYMGGVKYDPFVTTEMEARRYGGMSFGSFGHNSFFRDSIGYERKIGGGKFWLVYNPDEQAGTDGDYSIGFMMKAKSYEWFIAAAHDDDLDNNAATAPDLAFDALKVGGKWKSGPHTVKLQYEMTTLETGGTDEDGTILFVGYEMKMGANTFVAQIATGTVEDGSGTDQESDYLALGVVHKFNKKTRLFAGYGEMSADNLGNVAGANNGRDAISVGLRIDF